MPVEHGARDSWDSIIGRKTLRHAGREQISRRLRYLVWSCGGLLRKSATGGLELPLVTAGQAAGEREREGERDRASC